MGEWWDGRSASMIATVFLPLDRRPEIFFPAPDGASPLTCSSPHCPSPALSTTSITADSQSKMVGARYLFAECSANVALKASETPAFILGALTGVGGIIGYARTGSVPSIAAGLTVGILVSLEQPHLCPC